MTGAAETTHRVGDTRSDGYRFWSYRKRNGRIYEQWRSPEGFELARRSRNKYRPRRD